MKFKEIIIQHPDGNWEIKETVRIKTLGFDTVLNSGRKVNSHLINAIYGNQIHELLDVDLVKHHELDAWEISI